MNGGSPALGLMGGLGFVGLDYAGLGVSWGGAWGELGRGLG